METDKLKELEAKVRETEGADKSAECLVNGVADALDGLTADPVAIKALAKDLRDSAAAIGSAVTDSPSKGSGGHGTSAGTTHKPRDK